MFPNWIEYNRQLFEKQRIEKFLDLLDVIDLMKQMSRDLNVDITLSWGLPEDDEV